MHLTRHTDYALRLLIHLAGAEEHRASIAEVAEGQAISRAHLMKVANGLAHAGFLEATRGRGGGLRRVRGGCVARARQLALRRQHRQGSQTHVNFQ